MQSTKSREEILSLPKPTKWRVIFSDADPFCVDAQLVLQRRRPGAKSEWALSCTPPGRHELKVPLKLTDKIWSGNVWPDGPGKGKWLVVFEQVTLPALPGVAGPKKLLYGGFVHPSKQEQGTWGAEEDDPPIPTDA